MDHNGGKLTKLQLEALELAHKWKTRGYNARDRFSRREMNNCLKLGLLQINDAGRYEITDAGRAALASS